MDGPKTTSNFGSIEVAQVIGYDAEHNAVYVRYASGQSPYLPARMLYKGNADQYRVEQEPLPLLGTWGVVVTTSDDDRFPIWLGAYYPTIQDAITSSSVLQDSQIKYISHWSGFYSLMDGFGQFYERYPEGTDIRISSTNTPPSTFRHIVQLSETSQYGTPQVRVQLPNSERVPNPPSSFYVSINHPSGASATITPSGIVTITGGNPQLSTITMTPSGIVTINAGANPISGAQASPEIILNSQTGEVYIYSQNQKGIITMDNQGNIVIQSANGNITVEAADQINITANGGDIFLATNQHPAGESINTIIDTYNIHNHGGVTTGTDNTAVPNQILP